MSEDQELGPGPGGEFTEGRTGGMGGCVVFLPYRNAAVPPCLGIDFVDEDIAA